MDFRHLNRRYDKKNLVEGGLKMKDSVETEYDLCQWQKSKFKNI